MDYFVKLDKFEFIDDKYGKLRWWRKLPYWRNQLLFPRTGAGPAPVELKKEYKGHLLKNLFEAIGFDSPRLNRIIAFHNHQLKLRWRLRNFISLFITLPLSIIISLGFLELYKIISRFIPYPIIENGFSAPYTFLVGFVLMNLTYMLFIFVITRLVYKITETLTIRRYADTLCTLTIVYLIIELSRDDVLIDTEKRRSIMSRLNDLARNTLFLTQRFASKSEMEQTWAMKHFRYMERYIRERERWVISPTETTLADLRKDFYNLVDIYLTGNYGKFDWKLVTPPPEAVTLNKRQHLLFVLPRVVGIILPIILLGVLLWQHAQLESVGIGTNILALIFIAWFLLAIDASLKLGIVADIINLAKEIKNLK